jgi:hypothetical protein
MATADPDPVNITSPRGSPPVPDPTELTDRAIAKLKTELTAYIDGQIEVRDERLRGIDEATKVRYGHLTDMHTESKNWVDNLKDLHEVKFSSIQTQFKERDIRAEREARDNKVAVDAAFAAQKEAAAKQDEANAKAIDKSEKATAETIKTNQELSISKIDALSSGLEDLKLEVRTISAAKAGQQEQRVQTTENRAGLYAAIAAIGGVILVVLAVLAFIVAEAAKTAA